MSKLRSRSSKSRLKLYCFLLLGGLFLLPAGYLLGNEIQIVGAHSWKSPFGYRSISFGTPSRSGPPDAMGTSVTGERFSGIRLDLNRDLVRLGASLGFNDVTIQTERATVAKLEDLRRWADETGNFKFIKDQGMTISVWVHEFCELPTDIGNPTLDNEKLWNLVRERYHRLCRLLPEVDYFVLTVVESDVRVTEDPDVLTKLVTIVNEECRKANKKLIYRTFQWHVEEAEVMMRSMSALPKDVIVMSKCVPQDWHLRGVNDIFIGKAGQRDQYIEFDIAGEYNKLTHVACAFTDVLKRQLDYARKNNCDGFAVRADRYGPSCYGQAQEANLWFLGLYGSGRCDDEQKIWQRYATELFGAKAAPAMIEALYPSGDVVAEAICVEQESFGYSRDVIPAARKMENPFDVLHSPAKYDKSLEPIYQKIIAGDPEIIQRKAVAFEKHLASADRSLRLIDSVKDELPPGAYPFFRWKLEENRFLLEMFCNMELAWLKDQRMRRASDTREKKVLEKQVQTHLQTFRQLYDSQSGKTLKVTWRGATHSLMRGSCHNWLEWQKRFEDYHRSATGIEAVDTGIATGKPVSCSSEKADTSARHGNDGDPNTRWCADDARADSWWQVDLNKPYDLDRIKIIWEFDDRPELYKIEGSANAQQWTPLVDRTDHLDVTKQTEHPVSARGIRYVRITITWSKETRPASFSEFQVYGHTSSENARQEVAPPKSVTTDAPAEVKPANGPMMTSWAKDVTPDNVWPEYPRPQMIRDHWQNLNGLWDYAIVAKDASKPAAWDGQILVPFCPESALSGVMKQVLPDQCLWYHRMFQSPTMKKGEHLLLHFGAVDWKTTVWLNGTVVGTHTGGYDPFTIDVTEVLKDSQNELVIQVWDPSNTGTQPKGKQNLKPGGIKYTAVTGIWQTVWMETVPTVHIQSLKLVTDIERGVVQVTVNASGPAKVALTAKVGGKKVAEAKGEAGQVVELRIKDAKLWSPDSPNLYDLNVSLVDDSGGMDRVDSYFGMRKIEVKKDNAGINRLFLNNKVLFQYGPLDQGWWPDGLYTPATEEALKYDISMIKKFGMNMARKHVKVESARWYHACDKLGLLVWQDMPHGNSATNHQSKANFRVELKAMMNTLQNFPCIVMWIPFNEGWGQHDTEEIVKWMQAYDPTRPVNEVSGYLENNHDSGNVADLHSYPGPSMRDLENNRVCVMGEFGGLGLPIEGHLWQTTRNWGYASYKTTDELTSSYVNLLTLMRPLIAQGLSAAVYTQTTDVEGEVNGLMTYDRKVIKMNLDRMTEAARKLYLEPPILKILVPTSQNQHQQWRYTTQEPPADWLQAAFDDSTWKTGPGGFGTSGTPGAPGAVVGTTWDSSDIWIRRTFELNTVPTEGNPVLKIKLCESAPTQVHLNGNLVWEKMKRTYNYDYVPLSEDAVKMLKSGVNTIAIHCEQKKGAQYVDAGLVDLIERK